MSLGNSSNLLKGGRMKEILITSNEAGKRLDKFLSQFFTETTMGFLYKMLRKKNIVLNKKKSTGKETLEEGDIISVFFSDETYYKLANKFVRQDNDYKEIKFEKQGKDFSKEYTRAYEKLGKLEIIYEDSNIILINKPAGVLTQKSATSDMSLNEWLIGYLLSTGKVSQELLSTFRPSVCNRLDRNTSGIVICSVSLPGAREMAKILKDRTLHKYYKTIVVGHVKKNAHIDGYLIKDKGKNKVRLVKSSNQNGAEKIETSYNVLKTGYLRSKNENFKENNIEKKGNSEGGIQVTELEVELHTGKPHQIRAHLASEGFPIIGDRKYGNEKVNAFIVKEFKLKHQLLHAYRVVFPELEGELSYLSGKEYRAELPSSFAKMVISEQ